jgi:hypothetical protein
LRAQIDDSDLRSEIKAARTASAINKGSEKKNQRRSRDLHYCPS